MFKSSCFFLLWLLLPLFASAHLVEPVKTAEQAGHALVTEMLARDRGYHSYQTQVRMVIRAANGDEAERQLWIQGLEQDSGGDHILSYFDSPRDLAGTALLTHSKALTADDQWLYLPSVQRVKRISSGNQSGPFMGSEFAYEDMSSWQLEKFRYQLDSEDQDEQHHYWVINSYPQYPNSGYSMLKVWLDQQLYQPRRIDYYDRNGRLLKRLELLDYQLYQDKFWRPHRSVMTNLQNQRQTILHWDGYELGLALSPQQFQPNQLRFAAGPR